MIKRIVVTYFGILGTLLVLDYLWIRYFMGPYFISKHSYHVTGEVQIIPVILFYLIYVVGVEFFVVRRARLGGWNLSQTYMMGSLFGFINYATYDLTNQAVMTYWSTSVTILDLSWGTFMTGLASLIGLVVCKRFVSQ